MQSQQLALSFYMKLTSPGETFAPDHLPQDLPRVPPFASITTPNDLRYYLAFFNHMVSIILLNLNLFSKSKFFLDIFSPHSGLLFFPS